MWALKRALKYLLNQALDKSTTMNVWSCSFDTSLIIWKTFEDHCIRERIILHVINDLFACTNLFFHLDHSSFSNHLPSILLNLNMISHETTSTWLLYFVPSNSHAKFVPPLIITSSHQIVVKADLSLKWFDEYNHQLSALFMI